MYLNIQKFQNAAGTLGDDSWRKYLNPNRSANWARTPSEWDTSWLGEDKIAQGSEYKDWTADLLQAVESAKGALTFTPTHDPINAGQYDTGYQGWNKAFAKLNLNANYFGDDQSKFDQLGPTTYTRYRYYTNLKTRHNNAQNAIKTNNGSIYWDGSKWVSIPNPTVTSGQPAGQTGTPKQTGATEDPAQQQPGHPGNTEEEPTKKPLWTDWIPHTSQLATDLVASTNKFKLATQRDVPLQSSFYEHYQTGDNYFQQQALKQQAADIRSRGNQNLTSDMNYNLRQRQAYEDKAQQLELNAQDIKANAYNQSMREAMAVANENKQREVAKDNTNRGKIAAFRNYVNDAKQALNAEQAAAWKSFQGDMYTDATQFKSTDLINDAYRKEKKNALDYATTINQLYKDYNDVWADPTTSDVYKEFAAYVANPNTGQAFGHRPVNPDSPEYKTWLRNQWDSDAAKTWRERWQKAKDEADLLMNDQAKALKLKMQAGDVDTLYYFPGSLAYVSSSTTTSREPARIITSAKGGKVSRLIDYTNSNQKQMQFSQKQQMEANKRNVDHLNRELDRLNREQVALLRAMFK